MPDGPTPRQRAEHDAARLTLAALANEFTARDGQLRLARTGLLPMPDDDRAARALDTLALAHVLAYRLVADRWRWALDALDAGAHLPAIAEAIGCHVDEVDRGARLWLHEAREAGEVTVEFHDRAIAVLEQELDALYGPRPPSDDPDSVWPRPGEGQPGGSAS